MDTVLFTAVDGIVYRITSITPTRVFGKPQGSGRGKPKQFAKETVESYLGTVLTPTVQVDHVRKPRTRKTVSPTEGETVSSNEVESVEDVHNLETTPNLPTDGELDTLKTVEGDYGVTPELDGYSDNNTL